MSVRCPDCGASAGYGHELGHKSDCPALSRARAHITRAMDFRRSDASEAEVAQLRLRNAELEALINTPETADFMKGVPLEAVHQRERWGSDHDAGKQALDWFWLIGYLAQKAATAHLAGDVEKAKHHTISTAAALSNWHLQLTGADTRMRPGIDDRQLNTFHRPEGKSHD